MALKKTIFNNLWLEEEEFKPWLRKDNYDINCGYCVGISQEMFLSE